MTVRDRPQLWMLDLDQPASSPVRLDAAGDADGPLWPAPGNTSLTGVWSPAGGRVAVRYAEPPALGVIDVASPGAVRDLGLPDIAPFDVAQWGARTWSPEGERLVVTTSDGSAAWVSHVDGSGAQRVAGGLRALMTPSWSPDGRYVLLYSGNGDGTASSYVTPVDADAPQLISPYSTWWGAAGSQLLAHQGGNEWDVIDVEADARERVTAGTMFGPTFNGDGTWLLAGGLPETTVRARGCGEPIVVNGPSFAWEVVTTADGDHFAFSDDLGAGVDGLGAHLWALDRTGDEWAVRPLYTPTTPERRADWPVASANGSRIAWLLGGNETERFLVTHDGVTDAVKVPAPGIVQPVVQGSYWFSPDLRRFAYQAGTGASATLRVYAIDDPSMPQFLGELAAPDGRPIYSMTWAPDGNSFGYAVWVDNVGSIARSGLYVARIQGAALEAPQFLGTTLVQGDVAFHWEP